MIDTSVVLTIVVVSLLINIILFIKLMQLKKDLFNVIHSTRLTREEVEKLNERLKRIKTL